VIPRRNPGPRPQTRQERQVVADSVAARLLEVYGDRVAAIGIYGSTARQDDGDFSDLELICIVAEGAEADYEWLHDGLKIEVNIANWATIMKRAAEVDDNWSQTHGAYVHVRALHDPQGLFPKLRRIATSPSPESVTRAMRGIIVGDMLDRLTKVRNAELSAPSSPIPELAVLMAQYGAWLVGLANRHLYGGSQTVLPRALLLPDRPKGFDELCRMVLSGDMRDFPTLATAIERFWDGVVDWATRHGIPVEQAAPIPF